MSVLISITIPEEIKEKLKNVENKSGLITQLLTQYFEKEEDPEALKLKREKFINDFNSKIRIFDYNIEVKEKQFQTEAEAKQEATDRTKRIEEGVKKKVAELKAKNHKPNFGSPEA